ncbi:MAG TPA: carboxypeptidase-like regulatory domain-containing protein [Coleofasciculaceae cyanobacterium]
MSSDQQFQIKISNFNIQSSKLCNLGLGCLGLIAGWVLGIAPTALSQIDFYNLDHQGLTPTTNNQNLSSLFPTLSGLRPATLTLKLRPPLPIFRLGQANSEQSPPKVQMRFTVFPVGMNVGKRSVIFGVLVRGLENGTEAVDFGDWLVPFDAVVEALKLKVMPLENGQLELRSTSSVTRIDPKELINDPELGLVFSVQQLQRLLGVPVEFDINEYAIVLNPAQIEPIPGQTRITQAPVQLEGLPRIKAPDVTIAAVEQRVNATNLQGDSLDVQGELQAVGSIFSGSGYVRINQPEIGDSRTWNVAEAQYLQQNLFADYVVGSQPTFWRSQRAGNYWGFTTIQRQGFTSPEQLYGGGFSPRERLQSNSVGRTVVGEAEPGTLVQLMEGFGGRVLDEVLVDSSGIYRFENVAVEGNIFGSNYQVLLYRQGRTQPPEIREATFSTVPGQIPAGASATIISAGVGRNVDANRFLGKFTDIQGGIGQRWGVSESFTVGVGTVYDQTVRGLGEIFFRPSNVLFEVSASVLTPDDKNTWDIDANVYYQPTPNIIARFNSDRFSRRFNLDWRLSPQFTLLGSYNSLDGIAAGMQIALSSPVGFTFARATLDEQNRLRWTLIQRLGALEFNGRGNEVGTLSELKYNLSGERLFDTGHALLLDYETLNLTAPEQLLTLGWRYRSPAQAADGNYLWETYLGYGVGSQGSGIVATTQIAALPGLLLRLRYQGISVNLGEESYSIELVSSANLQRGIFPGDRRADYLRTQGGLLIQPFFDRNNNAKHDPEEEYYTETANLLFILNNQPLKSSRPEVQGDRVLVRLPPGTYRLDLDPAGFPLDWQPSVDAMAVDVVAGSYTPIPVPLIPSFSLSGVVTDNTGTAVAGARVEAIGSKGTQRRFSVTNGAGVYYMERLQPDTYTLLVNGEPTQPSTITLNNSSEPFSELNLLQKSGVNKKSFSYGKLKIFN